MSNYLERVEGRNEWRVKHPNYVRFFAKLNRMLERQGEKAVQYFLAHPVCEKCGEKRLSCLAIHHPEGRDKDVFQTLCCNCHAVRHSDSYTLEDVWKEVPQSNSSRLVSTLKGLTFEDV